MTKKNIDSRRISLVTMSANWASGVLGLNVSSYF